MDVPGLPPSAAVPWRQRMRHALHARVAALGLATPAVVAPARAAPRRAPRAALWGLGLGLGLGFDAGSPAPGSAPPAARAWAQAAAGSPGPGLVLAGNGHPASANGGGGGGKRKWAGTPGSAPPAKGKALAAAAAPRADLFADLPAANGAGPGAPELLQVYANREEFAVAQAAECCTHRRKPLC